MGPGSLHKISSFSHSLLVSEILNVTRVDNSDIRHLLVYTLVYHWNYMTII